MFILRAGKECASNRADVCLSGWALTIIQAVSQLSVDAMPSEVIQTEVGTEGERVNGVAPKKKGHDNGLLVIGLFKLGKALLFMCIGAGALHFIHKDLGDTILRIATVLRFDPESRLIGMTMAQVDLIDHHRLREISMATFAYSGLALTEGVGLMLEKEWAEYLTLGLTLSFLPWESTS